MAVWKEWLIDVTTLKGAPAVLEKEVFYDVPLCLKNDQTRDFYHPKQISFGPRHFQLSGRTENLDVSENFKSEVARRFNIDHSSRHDMELLIRIFKSNMKRLQKNYGIEIIHRFPEEDRPAVLSWMLARDGCFLLRVLDGFQDGRSPQGQKEGTGTSEGVEMTVLDHILKRDNHHPLLTEIVKDMFKLENQLPLWVLLEILKKFGRDAVAYSFEPALKFLSPIELNVEACSRPTYENRIHILQLLGEYMIDHEKDSSPSTGEENPQSEADHNALLSGSTWSHAKKIHKKHFRYIITMLWAVLALIFVLLLSPVLLVWLIVWSVRESCQIFFRGTAEDDLHVPTIEELHSIGVKFKSLKGKGISHIRFNERKPTLYLPKFTVNDGSEVILRNLLAMETQWEEAKIITRYVVFMNDLVNTSVDVARLRRRGIIANKLGSDEDVARLWNSVTVPVTDIPHYRPIDDVSKSINAYRKKWWRVLWAQFWSLYCSKPWLLASLVGGITLLWLTVFQVICLFNRCSKSGIGRME